jgi:hypothetical protein
MSDGMITPNEIALAFGLKYDIVVFSVKILDLGLERVGLSSSRGPTASGVLTAPETVEVECILR